MKDKIFWHYIYSFNNILYYLIFNLDYYCTNILYMIVQDLVITGIITADEFWANHATEYIKQKQTVAQEVGVSGKLYL